MSEETNNPTESDQTPKPEATEAVATEVQATETPVTEEKKEAPVKEAPAPKEPETAHDDFNWTISNRNQPIYTEEEREKYAAKYEATMGAVFESEVIKAKVHQITDGDAVLDINFKSDGLVPMSEFKDIEGLKIGDEVDVYVERQEDERGQLVLSRRKAKLLKAFTFKESSFKADSKLYFASLKLPNRK